MFWDGPEQGQVVELAVPERQVAFVRQHGLASRIGGRFVKIVLADGDLEVLATSLLDAQAVPAAALKMRYGWWWGLET